MAAVLLLPRAASHRVRSGRPDHLSLPRTFHAHDASQLERSGGECVAVLRSVYSILLFLGPLLSDVSLALPSPSTDSHRVFRKVQKHVFQRSSTLDLRPLWLRAALEVCTHCAAGLYYLAYVWPQPQLQPPFPLHHHRVYCLCHSPECSFNLWHLLSHLLSQMELNPGPFNVKEHVLITIFVSGKGGRDPNPHLIHFSKRTTVSSLRQNYVDLDDFDFSSPSPFLLLTPYTSPCSLAPLLVSGERRFRVRIWQRMGD